MTSDFVSFMELHEPQLKCINFPSQLFETLFHMLSRKSTGDVADVLKITKVHNSAAMLLTQKDLTANGCCFISRHLWSTDYSKKSINELKANALLLDNLAGIFNISAQLQFDEFQNYSQQKYNVEKVYPSSNKDTINTVVEQCDGDTLLALMKLEDGDYNSKSLSANTPECSFNEFKAALVSCGYNIETFNDNYLHKMHLNFVKSGKGNGTTLLYNWYEDNEEKVIFVYVSIPSTAKKRDITSNLKRNSWELIVNGKVLVSGILFNAIKVDSSFWSIDEPGLLCMTIEKMDVEEVWEELIKGEVKLSSADILHQFWIKQKCFNLYFSDILDSMWKYNQTYSLPSSGKRRPTWYVMDPYGSALTHARDPNFKCAPFFYVPDNQFINIFWPIKDISKGMRCTRDYVPPLFSNESAEIQRVRLKAFLGKKLSSTQLSLTESDNQNKEEKNEYQNVKLVLLNDVSRTQVASKKIFVSGMQITKIEKLNKMLDLNILVNEKEADIKILTLSDTLMDLGGDFVRSVEVFSSRDFLQSYFQYRFNKNSWLFKSMILPRDLVLFNEEFEKCDLPQHWIIKPSSKKTLDISVHVTSKFSRIVRMCEVGPIAVTKFVSTQPLFRSCRFALRYYVLLTHSSAFICTIPYIRLSEDKCSQNDFINEYDNAATVTESALIQDDDIFIEFKTAMNKLLLPVNPKRGWSYFEENLFKKIGYFSKILSGDLKYNENSLVMFSVDFIIDENFEARMVDIDDVYISPDQKVLLGAFNLALGYDSAQFIKVELS
ncbi:uncharacterized protein LOC100201735 isoform X1 [Hydra vulgaris]|uniref:uncharacterized protein LOC100201735 isoform X1 n=1 Tax=Hydra vulgaris TaxID=6087 RepID=UPI001F5E6422|nr:uncharacterized protein LOC100201735 [Hydra vulgaris]